MADYIITGKKGNGKTIFAVGVILDALVAGRRVATNIDIHLDKLTHVRSKVSITRIPDVPCEADFLALGRGQEGVEEDDNGVLIIDEGSKGLGARDWNNKNRAGVLDWLVHSRKYGWNTYTIAQGVGQLDKTMKTALAEYSITVARTDKWPIPFLGKLGKLRPCGKPFTLPKMHFGTTRQGFAQDGMVLDRSWYRGPPLYDCYDTAQILVERDPFDEKFFGVHSVLSPWHTIGRYLGEPEKSLSDKLKLWWDGEYARRAKPALKPKHPLVELLGKLPPDQAARHWQRLDALGVFSSKPGLAGPYGIAYG